MPQATQAQKVEAVSVQSTLQRSTFGRFWKAIKLLAPSQKEQFKLPQVVVIGNESVGKSSLLEGITKCAVFPRARTLCTKCPVRLRLKQVDESQGAHVRLIHQGITTTLKSRDEILGNVSKLMRQWPGDVLKFEEIVIIIAEVDVPTLELVDLPGIREYPPELREQSKQLVSKYLAEPNSMFICVVPAPAMRLPAVQAIGMVHDSRRHRDTILALTQVDQVQEKGLINFEDNVFKRILGTSEELKAMPRFRGCVAVVNRTEVDGSLTLAQAATAEQQFFQEKVFAKLPSCFEAQRKLLESCCGLPQLVQMMDAAFHDFICQSWKPAALQGLGPQINKVQADLHALGAPLSTLTTKEVLLEVYQQVDWDVLCRDILQVNTMVKSKTDLYKPVALHAFYQSRGLGAIQWGTPAWSFVTSRVIEDVLPACECGDSYLLAVLPTISYVFNNGKPEIHLKRLTGLRDALVRDLLPKQYAASKQLAEKLIHGYAALQIEMKCHESGLDGNTFTRLQSFINGCMQRYMLEGFGSCLKTENPLGALFAKEFKLEEDAEYSSKRSRLDHELKQLLASQTTITNIDQELK